MRVQVRLNVSVTRARLSCPPAMSPPVGRDARPCSACEAHMPVEPSKEGLPIPVTYIHSTLPVGQYQMIHVHVHVPVSGRDTSTSIVS